MALPSRGKSLHKAADAQKYVPYLRYYKTVSLTDVLRVHACVVTRMGEEGSWRDGKDHSFMCQASLDFILGL